MLERRKYLILLVDPDPAFRRATRESLSAEGLLVVGIPRVSEAMNTAKDIRFDLLITDPFLPFVLDLANAMARQNPEQKTLFLSDYPPGRVKTFGLCPPEADIQQKPIAGKVLAERVKACLSDGETWARMIASWRGADSPQSRQDEKRESPNLSEMA